RPGQAAGQGIIRKATPAADVLINGVRLGAEPTPLLHGDKVEVGDHELTFVDERRSGSTQFVQALSVPEGAEAGGAVQPRPGAKAAAIGTSGGRVVSLTDGREYVITGTSLVFGREAGCDVVVAGKDVSRRHAEIVHTPRGYLVVDSSTNGTFVNEEQVQGQHVLARTDVIRIGEEQFRFYAEAPPLTASSPPAASGVSPEQLKHTMHGMESAAPARPAGAAFASFLVRSGGLMGRRLPVKTPVVNLGRADYNDIVLPDPSVSTSHAKLHRREGVWVLVDLDSTNGTFVEGERVSGEAPLAPGPGRAAACVRPPRHEACSPTASGPAAAASQEGERLWLECGGLRDRGRRRGRAPVPVAGLAESRAYHLRRSDRRRHHPVGER